MRDNHLIASKSHSSSSVSFKNPDSTFSCSGIAGSVTLRCLLFLVHLVAFAAVSLEPVSLFRAPLIQLQIHKLSPYNPLSFSSNRKTSNTLLDCVTSRIVSRLLSLHCLSARCVAPTSPFPPDNLAKSFAFCSQPAKLFLANSSPTPLHTKNASQQNNRSKSGSCSKSSQHSSVDLFCFRHSELGSPAILVTQELNPSHNTRPQNNSKPPLVPMTGTLGCLPPTTGQGPSQTPYSGSGVPSGCLSSTKDAFHANDDSDKDGNPDKDGDSNGTNAPNPEDKGLDPQNNSSGHRAKGGDKPHLYYYSRSHQVDPCPDEEITSQETIQLSYHRLSFGTCIIALTNQAAFCKVRWISFNSMSPAELNGWEKLFFHLLERCDHVSPVKGNGAQSGGMMWADGWRKSLDPGQLVGRFCCVGKMKKAMERAQYNPVISN
ncbi:hypothetical protein PCASD_23445 [Puccinia coronata f. sp. avenae]|uniref:Tet-like 2OG-Fe(II) oxygenase domain-containing protein n=1 Tax=Puccinia coronata f. sp. avenae TaxID=200324 RepID=A0A2N5SVY4_9BASI|nr:hypothetical protein PCASD_23445 [Puccinia coronata f. sp. avenae]